MDENRNISVSADPWNFSTGLPVSTVVNDLENVTNCPDMTSMAATTVLIRKSFTPCVYVVGIPGNLISFLVWMRPRMQQTSGVYLAALALVDLLFLVLQMIYTLDVLWNIRALSVPIICEIFPVIFLCLQYLDPLLVLAFTTERYIAICYPFKREKYCTKKRAGFVTLSLASFSLALGAMQGYFWTYEDAICLVREEVLVGGIKSIWNVWSLITEPLSFLIVPLSVLALNISVLKQIRRKRFSEFDSSQVHHTKEKSSACATTVLLYVSFYFILSTLPISVVYIVRFYITCLNPAYLFSDVIVEAFGHTHFAVNFCIYIVTGKVFREETKRMFRINSTYSPGR